VRAGEGTCRKAKQEREHAAAGNNTDTPVPSLSWIFALTAATVSPLSTSTMAVFPVGVFTKTCISSISLESSLWFDGGRSPW
jgi:hypothetical protein